MGFRLSSWGIQNPVPVVILFAALTIAGIMAYMALPVRQFPDVTVPVVVVDVSQAGAAPQEMETQITRKVEDAVSGINNVKHITSEVTLGSSETQIEFNLGADLQRATDDVRSAVALARVNLPRDIDPPNVFRVEADAQPVSYYAVQAPQMSPTDLSWFIDNTLAREVQKKQGVGQLTRLGGLDREISVTLDPDRMAALGVTAPQVNEALRGFTNNVSGGRADVGDRETTIRVLGTPATVEALRQISVPLGAGRFAKLSDVADVGEGSAEVRRFARLNGKPSVAFQVTMIKGGSEVQVADRIKEALDEVSLTNKGLTFTKVYSTADDTKQSFHSTQAVLLEGMGLAALVVLLFLREWRATAITAVAMPLSLIPTFAAMMLLGFSLNVVTLLSLTLVIGILIDDAIVEIENIQKRIERGQRPYDAAMEGADAIGLAVIACTLTIVAVFTPVSFMNNMVGQYFKEFGLTVSVAVLFSLLVARLLTPLLAAYFLKANQAPKPSRPLPGYYEHSLGWALRHKWISIALGGLFVIGSFALLVVAVPKGFLPTEDPGVFRLQIQGPPNTSKTDMERAVQQITTMMLAKPDVESVFASVGGGGDLTSGSATILLKEDRSLTTDKFKQSIRDELRGISDARVVTEGGFGGSDVEMILASQNGKVLERVQERLLREMRGVNVISDPRPSPSPPSTELVVRPKVEEAARLGVDTETIARLARVATIGDIDANVAKFNEGERQIPIRVRMPTSARSDLDTIGRLQVPTASGAPTPLSSVADIDFEAGPAKIVRYDRERRVSVQADLIGGATLGQALGAINGLPVMKQLPPEVHRAVQGDQEAFQDLFTGMIGALIAGIAMIYAVLVLLFKSFFKPAVILSSLPLTLGGAVFGLMVTQLTLSLPSMIGMFMLMGIAAKNSILLVEFAIEDERAGQDRLEALMNACRERARPIVMTSFAMVAGMLPTALGIGEGAAFRQPMAVAVIGGLFTSTVLSLILVPVVYEVFDQLENWLGPKFSRIVTPREASEAREHRDELFGRPPFPAE